MIKPSALTHELKSTLTFDVFVPGHDPRVTTELFKTSRLELIEREGGKCWICGKTEQQSGHPLEAHHHPIERSFADMVDWSMGSMIRRDFPTFHWDTFDASNPYSFVDDMMVNGLLLCIDHHIGMNQGIHMLPHPIWIAQKYGREGYQFSNIEILHHEQ